MIELRDLFIATFSILYGIMLNASFGLSLFHWGWLGIEGQKNVGYRILVTFLIFNLFPFFQFAYIYYQIPADFFNFNVVNFLGVCFLSLSVFACYRIYHLLLTKKEIVEFLYDRESCALCEFWDRYDRCMGNSLFGQSLASFFYLILIKFGLMLVKYNLEIGNLVLFEIFSTNFFSISLIIVVTYGLGFLNGST